jgi:tetratricopeptide (TPR) repeat protein
MLLQTDSYITKQISQQQQQQSNFNFNHQLTSNNYKAIENLMQLIRILSEICEFYLRHNRIQDAELCCNEIGSLHSMSYDFMYLKGRIYQFKKDYLNAKLCFNNVLSINPTHINSLEQISICLFHLNELNLGEKMIRDAITINSSLPHLWYILGYILDASNDSESALKCYQTSLQLESTHPIVQFSSLTKIL